MYSNRKHYCLLGTWVQQQEEPLKSDIIELLASGASTASLHRFFNQKFEDLNCGLTAFKSHRKRWCSCP
jgi:hypothetical protein